jgi:hypothetical protein
MVFSCKKETKEPIVEQIPADAIDTLTKLNTFPVTLIGMDSVECGAEIINTHNLQIKSAGLCWSTKPLPTISDFKTTNKVLGSAFATSIKKLLPGTIYYIRAYAQTSKGTAYGTQRVFATDTITYGKFINGGLLFYVFVPGDVGYVEGEFHGLVTTGRFNNTRFVWSAVDTLTNASDSISLFSTANANKIISVFGAGNYAAWYCDSLVYNGYSDWYMPNLREAQLLRKNVPVGLIWCSTEFDKNRAYTSSTLQRDRIQLKTKLISSIVIRKF